MNIMLKIIEILVTDMDIEHKMIVALFLIGLAAYKKLFKGKRKSTRKNANKKNNRYKQTRTFAPNQNFFCILLKSITFAPLTLLVFWTGKPRRTGLFL